ncbi:hypothetical protein AB6A40_002360 [Gnathostoma spinigerum]|uniref:Renin receptor-like C-terminal transmembrane spanning segment domain-containing protein n=1 Tax=Gnathostoma spinigerum TaxID=75299 RepID=A0ABD6E7P9_9BILA
MTSLKVCLATLCLLSGSHAVTLEFSAVPASISAPSAAELKAADYALLNNYMLGLTAQKPDGWDGKGSILVRPKALIAVHVVGLDSDSSQNPHFDLGTGSVNLNAVNDALGEAFGDKREWTVVSSSGITGANFAKSVNDAKPNHVIKTEALPLRSEIENIYKLAEALKAGGARLQLSSPEFHAVHISGLSAVKTSDPSNYKEAAREVRDAISFLMDTAQPIYGNQLLGEVVYVSDEEHHVHRRAVAEQSSTFDEQLMRLRRALHVYSFTAPDYPAMFAIVAGLVIILSIAILFIAVAIWNVDPGRDSIIYRMTTTRMKKD